jgi:hypothetical protein
MIIKEIAIKESLPKEQIDAAKQMIQTLKNALKMYPDDKELGAEMQKRIDALEKAISGNKDKDKGGLDAAPKAAPKAKWKAVVPQPNGYGREQGKAIITNGSKYAKIGLTKHKGNSSGPGQADFEHYKGNNVQYDPKNNKLGLQMMNALRLNVNNVDLSGLDQNYSKMTGPDGNNELPTGPGGDEALPKSEPQGDGAGQDNSPNTDAEKDQEQTSDINHSSIAQVLYDAVDGIGTTEADIISSIEQIQTQADWNQVSEAFRRILLDAATLGSTKRKISRQSAPLWTRIDSELNDDDIKPVIDHLEDMGIEWTVDTTKATSNAESINNKENTMNETTNECGMEGTEGMDMGSDGKVTISGSVDDLIRMMQLAGASGAKEVGPDDISPRMSMEPQGSPSMGDMIHMMSTEDEAEDYDGNFPDASTEPDEKYMNNVSASVPAGNDLHKVKKSYKATSGGDNPMNTEASIKNTLLNALAEKKAKPDFPDIDGDGNTKEPMKKAAKEKGDKKSSKGLSAKQKKLPAGLQKAIAGKK